MKNREARNLKNTANTDTVRHHPDKPDDAIVHLNTRVPNRFRKTVKTCAHLTGFDMEQIAIDAWRLYLELGAEAEKLTGDEQLIMRRKIILKALEKVVPKGDQQKKLLEMVRDRGFEPLTPTVSMLRSHGQFVFRFSDGPIQKSPQKETQTVS